MLPRMRGDEVVHAAMRGVVGSMAMTGMRTLAGNVGLMRETPPHAILRQSTKGLFRAVPRKKRKAVQELAHWGAGATFGAVYGALPDGFRSQPWSGPAFGIAVWLGFEAGIAPLLGIHEQRRIRPVDRIALVADHLLYGFVLDQLRRQPQDVPAQA